MLAQDILAWTVLARQNRLVEGSLTRGPRSEGRDLPAKD